MPNRVLFEQFLVAFTVPSKLSEAEVVAAKDVLNSREFRTALSRAIEELRTRFEPLRKVRCNVTV